MRSYFGKKANYQQPERYGNNHGVVSFWQRCRNGVSTGESLRVSTIGNMAAAAGDKTLHIADARGFCSAVCKVIGSTGKCPLPPLHNPWKKPDVGRFAPLCQNPAVLSCICDVAGDRATTTPKLDRNMTTQHNPTPICPVSPNEPYVATAVVPTVEVAR